MNHRKLCHDNLCRNSRIECVFVSVLSIIFGIFNILLKLQSDGCWPNSVCWIGNVLIAKGCGINLLLMNVIVHQRLFSCFYFLFFSILVFILVFNYKIALAKVL